MKIGCLHGCPLDYHEPSCPVAIRQAERDQAQQDDPRLRAAARELYDLGYHAGYAAATRDAQEAERSKTVIRVDRITESGDACECGATRDSDGFCFTCETRTGAS